jgi:hypothetical protein
LFLAQLPFAILIAAGIVLLALDVIGVKSGKSLGTKLMVGMVTTLLPVILILLFIALLPSFLPMASGLFPGQTIPTQVESMVRTVSGSPVGGTTSSQFPVVGITTVNWGLSIGAYLFIVAAILRMIGGFVMYSASKLQKETPPPPPPPENPQAPSTK